MAAEFVQIGSKIFQTTEIIKLLERYQLLYPLLRGMIIDEAIQELTCTQEQVDEALENFLRQQNLTSPENLQTWLETQRLTMEKLREHVARPILIEKFKHSSWDSKVQPYFLSRKKDLDQVMYSLLRVKQENIAQELYFRIEEGESSFAEIARQYSQGPEAHTSGVIGPIPLNSVHPELARLLSKAQSGELQSPVRIDGWFVIVRLEKFLSAQLDQSMKNKLIDEIFEDWINQNIRQIGPLKILDQRPQNLV